MFHTIHLYKLWLCSQGNNSVLSDLDSMHIRLNMHGHEHERMYQQVGNRRTAMLHIYIHLAKKLPIAWYKGQAKSPEMAGPKTCLLQAFSRNSHNGPIAAKYRL